MGRCGGLVYTVYVKSDTLEAMLQITHSALEAGVETRGLGEMIPLAIASRYNISRETDSLSS